MAHALSRRLRTSALAAVLLSVVPCAAALAKSPPKPASKPATPAAKPKDILETLGATTEPSVKTFLDALKAADLTDKVKGAGPFTVFVPTDDAFKKYVEANAPDLMKPEHKADLKALLSDQIVSGKLLAADLAKTKSLKSIGGHALAVKLNDDKSWAGVEGAKPTKADVTAGNGVIHFMDAPIMFVKPEKPGGKDPGKADPGMGGDAGMTDPAMN
jgi:uncharacterized surface protein with fasciclin (FAS1) repeats